MRRFFGYIHLIKQPLLGHTGQHLNFIGFGRWRFISCWKCNQSNDNTISNCGSCSATQDPSKIEYFELFNMKRDYAIDNKNVISQYHKLQKQFHPDKHSNSSQIEKEHADKMSTLVNNAYKTLIDPLERASYVLEVNGIVCNATTIDNTAVLSEVMVFNEKIQNLRNRHQYNKFHGELTDKIKDVQNKLTSAFKKENYEEASHLLANYRYYENLILKLTKRNEYRF